MDFKDLVSNRRKELNLSMEKLGELVGVSKATVHRWESGEIKNVRRDKIALLAEALQTTPAYLMGWEEEEKEIDPQWGNHKANIEYFSDNPELLNIYKDLVERNDIAILFDKTKDLEPKDIESVLLFVQMIRKERGLDD